MLLLCQNKRRQCSKLKLGKEYLKCLKEKISGGITTLDENGDNSGKGWYQKIKRRKTFTIKIENFIKDE